MIFAAPRFVVVDDTSEHLDAITAALNKLGTACIGVKYDPETELNASAFSGVRCLFMDLHLLDGSRTSDERRHFSLIGTILEDVISRSGGPFILVLWTRHAHLCAGLRDYLDQNLDATKPHARPLAILPLDKTAFLELQHHGVVKDEGGLRAAVEALVVENPQIAALLGWEMSVLSAAGDTLAELIALVPANDRVSASFPGALDVVLSRLARAAVGKPNVQFDKRAAITGVLSPILSDRVINNSTGGGGQDAWDRAVTQLADDSSPSDVEAASVNRMLHISTSSAERIRPTDWGAVVKVEDNVWSNREVFKRIFGITRDEFLENEIKLKAADFDKCRPVMVRVGAACDYAQSRSGPLTYLLGIEAPFGLIKKNQSRPGAEWASPVMNTPGHPDPFKIYFNVRFARTVTKQVASTWQVKYRFREQLLMMLLHHSTGYTSRPGVIELFPK